MTRTLSISSYFRISIPGRDPLHSPARFPTGYQPLHYGITPLYRRPSESKFEGEVHLWQSPEVTLTSRDAPPCSFQFRWKQDQRAVGATASTAYLDRKSGRQVADAQAKAGNWGLYQYSNRAHLPAADLSCEARAHCN
jgi:hypothetical protein